MSISEALQLPAQTSSPSPWFVLYGRYASVGVVDELQKFKEQESDIQLDDFFVPIEVKKVISRGKTTTRKQLYTGHYIFLKASKSDILRLKHAPTFTTDIRFLHPRVGSTMLITVPEREILSFRNAVLAMNSEVEYFQPNLETYSSVSGITSGAYMKYGRIAIAHCEAGVKSQKLVTAMAADQLLNISGVDASFVLADGDGEVSISGRSWGEINVQVILEKLGGGGHITSAGASVKDVRPEEAEQQLLKAIDEYMAN